MPGMRLLPEQLRVLDYRVEAEPTGWFAAFARLARHAPQLSGLQTRPSSRGDAGGRVMKGGLAVVFLILLAVVGAVVGLGFAFLGEGLKGIALIAFGIFLLQLSRSEGR
jgi:hypothetical protein